MVVPSPHREITTADHAKGGGQYASAAGDRGEEGGMAEVEDRNRTSATDTTNTNNKVLTFAFKFDP